MQTQVIKVYLNNFSINKLSAKPLTVPAAFNKFMILQPLSKNPQALLSLLFTFIKF